MGFWHIYFGLYGGGGDVAVSSGTLDWVIPSCRLEYDIPKAEES